MNIVQPYAKMLPPLAIQTMYQPTEFTLYDGIELLRRIEWCARVSHRSEEAVADNSYDRFLRSVVLQHGDWCYDEETEVLTSVGWKYWRDVVKSDQLATLNISNEIEYQYPDTLVESYYKGKMYSVNGKNVNLLVTPNHALYICPTTTKEGRKKQQFSLIKAIDIQDRAHAYLKIGNYSAANPISYAEAQFIGFAIGDAYINTDIARGSTLRFELSKKRKKEYLRDICGQAGMRFSETASNKPMCTKFNVSARNAIQKYLLQIYDDKKEKMIPSSLLLAGRETCAGILDGLINSDGHKDKNGISFDTTSESLSKTFQQLCLHAGTAADLTYILPANRKNVFPNAKASYRFQVLSKKSLKPEVNRFSGAVGRTEWIDWEGNIYCATVPNHTLYVRRKGKAVWSGNSVTEHVIVSVDFYMDRGITHEEVRHRIQAITQESTRFVNYEKKMAPSFIYPCSGNEVEGVVEKMDPDWQHVIQTCEDGYKKLIAKGWPPQRARSVFPNALGSRLIATMNLRSWRHFFLMRSTKEAHPQMRQVVNPLLKDFQRTIPILYEDIEPLAKQNENLKKAR